MSRSCEERIKSGSRDGAERAAPSPLSDPLDVCACVNSALLPMPSPIMARLYLNAVVPTTVAPFFAIASLVLMVIARDASAPGMVDGFGRHIEYLRDRKSVV